MLKRRSFLFLALILFLGAFCVSTHFSTREAQAVEIITHWVPHEVYGMPGEPGQTQVRCSFQVFMRNTWVIPKERLPIQGSTADLENSSSISLLPSRFYV
ncbi:MAG: hypothetical protein R3B66_00145 [Candidatus Scalinduaceae bacterium]